MRSIIFFVKLLSFFFATIFAWFLLLLFPHCCVAFATKKKMLWLFSRIVSAIEYIWFGQRKIYWQSSNRIWSHFGVHDFSVVYFVSFARKNVTFYSIVIWLKNLWVWPVLMKIENANVCWIALQFMDRTICISRNKWFQSERRVFHFFYI